MENADVSPPSCPLSDVVFTVIGLGAFVFDVGADFYLAFGYLRNGEVFWCCIVLTSLTATSVVAQIFSYCWFQADKEIQFPRLWSNRVTSCTNHGCSRLMVLHFFQLGHLLRYFQALEVGFKVWWKGWNAEYGAYMIYVSHDLSMLRLFETFLESAPQLILVIYVMICTNKAAIYQYTSIAASFICITWTVLDYHQSLRSFLPNKDTMSICSKASVFYFIWNLLLICPRIASLVLFTSVFHYYIVVHFIIICLAMFAWINLQKTEFMGNHHLEWFYRAVVSIVWYFCWFSVAAGRTLFRSLVYHTFILVDSAILLTFWFLYRDPEDTEPYWLPVLICVGVSYIAGLIIKCVYYKWFHPKRMTEHKVRLAQDEVDIEEDGPGPVWFRSVSLESGEQLLCNKRMHTLSKSFFPLPSVKHSAVCSQHILLDKNLIT